MLFALLLPCFLIVVVETVKCSSLNKDSVFEISVLKRFTEEPTKNKGL